MDKGLDPIKSRSIGDFLQMNLVYDTLLHAQDDGSYKPGLALSYKVEGDNSVTITLRPNLEFTDGTPLDATAVKFSIDRAVASKNTNLAPEINNVGSVDVVDPVTVKITMKTPTIGSFFELLAGRETMPVSPTAVNADPTGFNTKPVGAGPFTVTEYTPQSIMSLRKNPDYWDAKNWKLGGIDFIQATAGAPRINALSGGQADMAELDSSQTEDLQGVAGAKVDAAPSDANFLYLATCKNKPPFDNLKFREAVQMTMNRDAINQVLLNGAGPADVHDVAGAVDLLHQVAREQLCVQREEGEEALPAGRLELRRHVADRLHPLQPAAEDVRGDLPVADGRCRREGGAGPDDRHRQPVLHERADAGRDPRCGSGPGSRRSPGRSVRTAWRTSVSTATRTSTP